MINYYFIFPKTNSDYGSIAYVDLFKNIKSGNYRFKHYFITRDYMGTIPEFQARIFIPIHPSAFQNSLRNEYMIKKPQNYIDYKRIDNFYFFNSPQEIDPPKDDLVVLGKSQLSFIMSKQNVLFIIPDANDESALVGVGSDNLNLNINEN